MIDPHIDPAQIVRDIIYAVRGHLAEFGEHKVMHPHRLGSPCGHSSRPPFLKSPTSSFLVSTEMTGCPALWKACTSALMCSNWAFRSGCAVPSRASAVGLQAVAQLFQQICHQFMADLMALVVEFVSQLTHALASPPQRRFRIAAELSGSTNCSRSCSKVASLVTVRLAPAAGAADPVARGRASAAASSVRPWLMACRETPVARATAEMPP